VSSPEGTGREKVARRGRGEQPSEQRDVAEERGERREQMTSKEG
jgi:hypothetical protein